MRILAVDLGLARTGLAVCDELEMLASPHKVIAEKNRGRLIEQISAAAKELAVRQIVVGLPLNMDGTRGEKAEECEEIGEKIGKMSGIEVVMWDERCTTVSAHNALNVTNVRGKKRKGIVDAVAAVMILEGYLGYRKSSKI